jgi:hypothetical protein
MKTNTVRLTVLILALIVVGALIYFSKGNQPAQNESPNSPEEDSLISPSDVKGGEPEVVVNTTAVATNSTVVLNGTVNPNGADTTFWYDYGESTNLGSSSTGYSIGSGFTPIYAPSYIANLKANTTYRYQLVAKNKYGSAKSGIYSFRTTDQNPLPPGSEPTVKTNDATEVERTAARLRGTLNPRGWETTYWFEYGESPELGLVTEFKSAGNADEEGPVAIFLAKLKPVTKYYFRLNAQNQYGTVKGEVNSFTTTGPATALEPSIYESNPSKVTSTSATLKGAINPNAASTTYWFEYGKADSLANISAKTTPVKNLADATVKIYVTADVVGLSKDTDYMYRIVAKNQVGTTYGDLVYFRTLK